MLHEAEYLRMKCRNCGYEEWADADIADELATYNEETGRYEILLVCPECEGTMQWHNKECKVDKWNDDIDFDDLPL